MALENGRFYSLTACTQSTLWLTADNLPFFDNFNNLHFSIIIFAAPEFLTSTHLPLNLFITNFFFLSNYITLTSDFVSTGQSGIT